MNAGERLDSMSALVGVQVLLVDDNASVRSTITLVLEHCGATVTAVPGVAEALEALERERPQVLLTDIEMPGEDGYALIRKVRRLPPARGGGVPMVALTGLSGAQDRARLLHAGFQYHLSKPVNARRLVAVVAIMAVKE